MGLHARGILRLPQKLDTALDALAASATVTGCFPAQFAPADTVHKTAEIAHLADMDIVDRCATYEATY